jgi:hypothetical protein
MVHHGFGKRVAKRANLPAVGMSREHEMGASVGGDVEGVGPVTEDESKVLFSRPGESPVHALLVKAPGPLSLERGVVHSCNVKGGFADGDPRRATDEELHVGPIVYTPNVGGPAVILVVAEDGVGTEARPERTDGPKRRFELAQIVEHVAGEHDHIELVPSEAFEGLLHVAGASPVPQVKVGHLQDAQADERRM